MYADSQSLRSKTVPKRTRTVLCVSLGVDSLLFIRKIKRSSHAGDDGRPNERWTQLLNLPITSISLNSSISPTEGAGDGWGLAPFSGLATTRGAVRTGNSGRENIHAPIHPITQSVSDRIIRPASPTDVAPCPSFCVRLAVRLVPSVCPPRRLRLFREQLVCVQFLSPFRCIIGGGGQAKSSVASFAFSPAVCVKSQRERREICLRRLLL